MPDREKGRDKRPQSKSEIKIFKGIHQWTKKIELEDKRPASDLPIAAMKQQKAAPQAQTSLLPQLPPSANSLTLTFSHQQGRKKEKIESATRSAYHIA